MNPAAKRFERKYRAAADAIARLDIEQTLREEIAEALSGAFADDRDFRPDVFRLLASDPLVRCAGPIASAPFAEPCPHKSEIRVAMHLSTGPGGRSAAWLPRPPVVRCLRCGSAT